MSRPPYLSIVYETPQYVHQTDTSLPGDAHLCAQPFFEWWYCNLSPDAPFSVLKRINISCLHVVDQPAVLMLIFKGWVSCSTGWGCTYCLWIWVVVEDNMKTCWFWIPYWSPFSTFHSYAFIVEVIGFAAIDMLVYYLDSRWEPICF